MSDRCKCSHRMGFHEIKPGKHDRGQCSWKPCGCTQFRPDDQPREACPLCGAQWSPIEKARKEERG